MGGCFPESGKLPPLQIKKGDCMKFQYLEGARICKTFKDDCVIRSISHAMNKPYKQVFNDLMLLGMEIGAYPNHDKVWQTYLEKQHGWVKNKPPRDKNGKLIRLCDWVGVETAVVRNARHLTAVVDNRVCDTWDCTYRPVNTYWTPPK
jgi:hypothetical protein